MTLKMKPEPKRLLMEALVSDKYKQGTEYLKKIDNDGVVRHCCLGVACELAIKAGIIPEAEKPLYGLEKVWEFGEGYDTSTTILPYKVVEWLFEPVSSIDAQKELDPAAGDFEEPILLRHDKTLKKDIHATSLAMLNDSGKWDFQQIRDFIEKHF